jgi:Domain of unknown function (DUF4276)
MTFYIVPIVEGQTEQGCIERLLHRIWAELLCRPERLQLIEPFRGHRDALVHPNGEVLIESVRKAFGKLKGKAKREATAQSMVLILLDAEGDCPATLAPRLLEVAKKALPDDALVSCVLAKRMLENWIVAGASTLAGVNELPDALPVRDQFEARSGAAWLEAQFRSRDKTRKYRKTTDAEALIRVMALQECRDNAPSFDKLCRELEARLPRQPEAAGPSEEVAPPTPDGGSPP